MTVAEENQLRHEKALLHDQMEDFERQVVDLTEERDEHQKAVDELVKENDRLREALQPFADGHTRAGGKESWASCYVCPTKYRLAYIALNGDINEG
jgi:chromosome segregation ATPase